MNTDKLIHLELFKEVDVGGKPLAYCFAFVDSRRKIHFASFEHRRLNTKCLDEIVRRGNFIFNREETQELGAQKWWDLINVYTNVPDVYKQDKVYRGGRRKLLENRELDKVVGFVRSYKPVDRRNI